MEAGFSVLETMKSGGRPALRFAEEKPPAICVSRPRRRTTEVSERERQRIQIAEARLR